MPKLTQAQRTLLAAAAEREDGIVLPLPTTVTFNKAAATSVLKSLVRKGLVEEHATNAAAAIWRTAEDGTRATLVITVLGREAIGVEPPPRSAAKVDTPNEAEDAAPKPKRARSQQRRMPPASRVARPGTKQAMLVELLEREAGASLDEIVVATGWQAHSVRGAISGTLKKKLGLIVASEAVEGRGRVYRIVAGH